jgi:acetoin utilization deacetylase AcuC-like enzyme
MPIRKFGLVAKEVHSLPFVKLVEPAPLTEADLQRVHTQTYIDAIKTGQPRELAESQKFPWSPELYPSVLLTGGGCLAAAEWAMIDGSAAALVSGFHHACADHGEGFCTFNGLVVAIDALRAQSILQGVAILDCDLHYGNGTAALAASRPYIQAISVYGNDYKDNEAFRDVTTLHHQDGHNHKSVALPKRAGWDEMLEALEKAFYLIMERGRPDLLIYQAGADPFYLDPYSPLQLDHEDLQRRDEEVFKFARSRNLPIAWVLAGGYTADVRQVVKVHVNTFHAWKSVLG